MSNEPGRGVTGVTGVVGWVGTKKQTIKAVTLQSGIINFERNVMKYVDFVFKCRKKCNNKHLMTGPEGNS